MPVPVRQIVIASETGKGRAFTAALLAYILADDLWPGGAHDAFTRPAWMMIAASEHEATPFVENLRAGRRATLADGSKDHRNVPLVFECLRSAGYRYEPQRHPEGTVWQVYLPELFRLDPGMVDPKGVAFVVSPDAALPAWQRACEPANVERAVAHVLALGYVGTGKGDFYDSAAPWPNEALIRRLAPLSAFFAIYLARRTRAPILPDSRFYLQLLIAMLRAGQASISINRGEYRHSRDVVFGEHGGFGFTERDVQDVGLVPGVACKVKHTDLETTLAKEVAAFVRQVN